MKETRIMMGMPVTVEIADPSSDGSALERAFSYFVYVDKKFSIYKEDSEISRINRRELLPGQYSADMETVLRLSEQTKRETDGYFDIARPDGTYDPSGLVKGWAIYNAAQLLKLDGWREFFVDAGGDIEARGKVWSVGIRNPFKTDEIVKTLQVQDRGVATSGTYERGQHIYNPRRDHRSANEIVSLTVVGPNIYEADRFATAAFAMGRKGIIFLEKLPGFEAYMIDSAGIATMTGGLGQYMME